MPKRAIKPLEENDIKTVSELLNSDEEMLLEIKGISEASLEKIYDAVQAFVEKNQSKEETDNEEDKVDSNSEVTNSELEKVES
jgi:ERCC4-type nuclease